MKVEREQDMFESIARIETKLDTVIERQDDHETRIRANEQWRWKMAAVFTAIVVAIQMAWDTIAARLGVK